MERDAHNQQLTPLERLQLRDALQDRWREKVRQITLLSLARYDREHAERIASRAGVPLEGASLERAILRERARLEELEQAMHRLDDRNYGHCRQCGESIGFTRLAQTPEATSCGRCHPDEFAASNRSTDVGVA